MSRRVMHSDGNFEIFSGRRFDRCVSRGRRIVICSKSNIAGYHRCGGVRGDEGGADERAGRAWGAPGKGEGTRGALFLKFAWGIKARWLRSLAELLFADTECGGSKALCQAYVSLPFGNEWWEAEGETERKRKQAEGKRRTERQSEIEQRDSPSVFAAHLEKLSYDIQL